jgi:hypothetical protein
MAVGCHFLYPIKLTHAGPKDAVREAELKAPSGIVCSDLGGNIVNQNSRNKMRQCSDCKAPHQAKQMNQQKSDRLNSLALGGNPRHKTQLGKTHAQNATGPEKRTDKQTNHNPDESGWTTCIPTGKHRGRKTNAHQKHPKIHKLDAA